MKYLLILFLFFSCSQEEKSDSQLEKQALEKPGKGHGNNVGNQTTALLPLVFTQSSTSVTLNWELPVLVINEIFWWQWVVREETDPQGKITLLQIMTDDGPVDIQGSEWQGIKTWYQQTVNSYTVENLKPGYSYRFYVNGSYGPYYDVALSKAYITNVTPSILIP